MTHDEIKARYRDGERDFTRVILSGADLTGANLDGAKLTGADLTGANLSRATLTDADLTGADLDGAILRGANLRGADLYGANLRGADLSEADFRCADLRGADLRCADLRGADLPYVPVVVPDLDMRILSILDCQEGELDMAQWHTCETTHCLAGWAIHLAGKAGYDLESETGAEVAGALIYWHSTGSVPDFYAGTDDALAELRARAERCTQYEA